jgi:molybdopterin-guanine dinucleotide biosynthesis protein A
MMNVTADNVSAFVLAGGRSTRMGTDKAFVMLDGRTLLARALQLCRTVAKDVRIVGDAKKFASFAPVVEDLFPGCGPLGGIHAVLRASQTDFNFVLAVDLPFVTSAILRFLVAEAKASGALVTVPRADGRWQPLCAVYRRAFVDLAEKALCERRCKIDTLFSAAAVHVVEEHRLLAAGFTPQAFRNLNTPEELAQARNSYSVET